MTRAEVADQALKLRSMLNELFSGELPSPELDGPAFKKATKAILQNYNDFGEILVEINRQVFQLARISRDKETVNG
jgi:hypothetical protein